MGYPQAPDAAVRYIANELSDANGLVLWDALPASYQAEISDLAHRASEKIDAQNYERAFSLIEQIARILESKGEFILNTKLGGGLPEEELPNFQAALPLMGSLLDDLSSSKLATHAGLREFNGDAFGQLVLSLLRFIDVATAFDPKQAFYLSGLSDLEVKVVSQEAKSTTLQITLPGGEPMIENYTLVEGRWLPQPFIKQWQEGMANANKSLQLLSTEQMQTNQAQAAMILGLLEGVVAKIDFSETQESFDRALQSAVMPMMGILMMSGQSVINPSSSAAPAAVPETKLSRQDSVK